MNTTIFGTNAVREAIQNPSSIQKVLIENDLKNPAALKLKDEVMRSGVSYSFVPEQNYTNTPKKTTKVLWHSLDKSSFLS